VDPLIGFLAIAGLLVMAVRLSRRQRAPHSLFQPAFGATALAILFLVTGVFGLRVDKSDEAFVHVTRTGAVGWWDIVAGAVNEPIIETAYTSTSGRSLL
jgi:hypothetical protein